LPALLRGGCQADIDNLEPAKPRPFIPWLAISVCPPFRRFRGPVRHLLTVLLFEHFFAASFVVGAFLSLPLSGLIRLIRPIFLSLLLNQPLR
jgi:hypothetical protein